MSETLVVAKRPLPITILCILGFIGALLVIPVVFSPVAQQVGAWYPPYLGATALIGFISLVGLWFMKKWGAYSYIGLTAVNQIVLGSMGVWNVMVLLIPLIIVVLSLVYLSKMK